MPLALRAVDRRHAPTRRNSTGPIRAGRGGGGQPSGLPPRWPSQATTAWKPPTLPSL